MQGSDGGLIVASEVQEAQMKIHDILDSAMSKQVGNTVHILANLFISASSQHYDFWAFQYPFLHNIKDSIPPSEACLYGQINWLLAQADQQSTLGLSKCSALMRVVSTKPKSSFQFNVQKQPMPDSRGASLAKKPHLDTNPDSHQGSRKSPGEVSTSSTNSRKKGSQGGGIPPVLQSLTSSPSSVVQVGTLPKFLESMERHYLQCNSA